MNMGYIENNYFNEMATDIYICCMTFVMTSLVIISLKEFRWEIQSIYFFYFSALNENRAVNFLKLRTVFVEGVEKFGMDDLALEKSLNKVLLDNAIYGKIYKSLIIEDRVKSLTFERNLQTLKEYREIYEDPRIPSYSKWFLPSEAKNVIAYEHKLEEMKQEGVVETMPIPSGYAFTCFSSFEVVSKFKKFTKKLYKKTQYLS